MSNFAARPALVLDPEAQRRVRRLWDDGHDAREIAEMTGYARNASDPIEVRELLYRIGITFDEVKYRNNAPVLKLVCRYATCGKIFPWRRMAQVGRQPKYCSPGCLRQASYDRSRVVRSTEELAEITRARGRSFGRAMAMANKEHIAFLQREKVRKDIREGEW